MIRTGLLLLVLLCIGGCGWLTGPGACEDLTYTKSASTAPLSVPADLDPPQQVPAQRIPDVADNAAEPSRDCLVEPPTTLSARAEALANEPAKPSRKERKRITEWPTDEDAVGDWVALDPDKPGEIGANLGTMHGIATRDIGETLQGWAQARSFRQVAPYFAYYSTDFRPEDGKKAKKWRKRQEKEIRESEEVEISVYGMRARPVSGTRVHVTFFQRNRSLEITQVIRKEMVLVREEGGWAILRERAVGS